MEQIGNFLIADIFTYRLRIFFKRTITSILIFYIPFILIAQKFSISVNFELNNFKIEKVDSLNLIQCVENNDIRYFLPAGYPKLPYLSFFVLLPHNSRIERISIDRLDLEAIKGYYNVISTTSEDIDSDSSYSANTQSSKNNKMDSLKKYHPSDFQIVMYNSPELYAGFLINKIYICPFKYFPETRQMFFYANVFLSIYYQIDERPIKYELSPDKVKLSREFIRDMVINKEDIDKTVPLEEKIDYSKIRIYKKTEEDSVKENKPELSNSKKAENTKPFYIKSLKTK